MKLKYLVGKTITFANYRRIDSVYDDKPFIDLCFSDGSKCTIVSEYGGYSGNSEDEYPRYIFVKKYGYTCDNDDIPRYFKKFTPPKE